MSTDDQSTAKPILPYATPPRRFGSPRVAAFLSVLGVGTGLLGGTMLYYGIVALTNSSRNFNWVGFIFTIGINIGAVCMLVVARWLNISHRISGGR